MAIEGKVAKILNSRELIINKGANNGVTTGMKFDILEPKFDVFDPDTQEDLGHVQRSKITVEVIQAEPRFSIARTFETYRERTAQSTLSSLVSPAFVTKVKKIRENRSWSFEFSEDSVAVAVGDQVVQKLERVTQQS